LPHLIKEKPAMSKKFEQLLDYLVNEEMDKANELFHEIVVEKSREIYETMIAEEAEEESVEESDDDEAEESVEESDDDEAEESVEEGFGADDETSMSIGGDNDQADSMMHGVSGDNEPEMPGDEGDSEGGVSAGEEQILDVLQQLKAEFDSIVNGGGDTDSEDEPEDEPAEPSFGDDDDTSDDDEDEPEEKEESMGMPMREYVETVGTNWDKGSMKAQGQYVGAGSGDKDGAPVEGRSPISSGKGKPSTGANAGNILSGKGTDTSSNTGTSPNADKGSRGLVGATKGKFTGSGTHNVDGVKSGIKTVSKQGAGYPGNNKTPGPVGSGTGDKAGQTGDTGGKKQFLPQFGKK
jgi:hypothetical protein